MSGIVTGVLGLLGTGVSSFFGFKNQQAEVVKEAIGFLQDTARSDDARASAAAVIIAAEASSDSWITRSWRPLTAVSFVMLLFAYFFGYSTENVTPAMIDRIFDLVEFCLLGYMGASSWDKTVKTLNLGSVLKTFINKKLG